ncbi:MAG: hypothetical protein LBM60_01675 [Clostridium sp.]|jgi:phage tail-like protein|nr:hypothetical protein [Clostridium sp.]
MWERATGGRKVFIWDVQNDAGRTAGQYRQEGVLTLFSPLFDSGSSQAIWYLAQGKGLPHAFTLHFYAADTPPLEWLQTIQDPAISPQEKKRRFQPYACGSMNRHACCLLDRAVGRYLWVMMESWEEATGTLTLYFPKESWNAYLPELYRQGTKSVFLERFLSLFQIVAQDIEDKLAKAPERMLPTTCARSELSDIAAFLSEEAPHLWEEDMLSRYLDSVMAFYRRRGTLEGLRQKVLAFSGKVPIVAEYHPYQQERKGDRKKLIERLYGSNPYLVTVVLDVGEDVLEGGSGAHAMYRKLEPIILDCIPAHMETRIILLRGEIVLDSYAYLEINSRLRKELRGLES